VPFSDPARLGERKQQDLRWQSDFFKIGNFLQTIGISNAALVFLVRFRELGRKNKKLKLFIFQHAH